MAFVRTLSRVERANGGQLAPSHLAAEQRRMRRPKIAAIAKGEAARAPQAIGVLRLLAMTGRDHKTVLVIGDREIAVHLLDLRDCEPRLRQHRSAITLAELALAKIDAHGEHTLERSDDRRLGPGGQQIRQIAHRYAQ